MISIKGFMFSNFNEMYDFKLHCHSSTFNHVCDMLSELYYHKMSFDEFCDYSLESIAGDILGLYDIIIFNEPTYSYDENDNIYHSVSDFVHRINTLTNEMYDE